MHPNTIERVANPEDITVPPGYKIEVFAEKLTTPISIAFTDQGEMLIADAGISSGSGLSMLRSAGKMKCTLQISGSIKYLEAPSV